MCSESQHDPPQSSLYFTQNDKDHVDFYRKEDFGGTFQAFTTPAESHYRTSKASRVLMSSKKQDRLTGFLPAIPHPLIMQDRGVMGYN